MIFVHTDCTILHLILKEEWNTIRWQKYIYCRLYIKPQRFSVTFWRTFHVPVYVRTCKFQSSFSIIFATVWGEIFSYKANFNLILKRLADFPNTSLFFSTKMRKKSRSSSFLENCFFILLTNTKIKIEIIFQSNYSWTMLMHMKSVAKWSEM